MKIYNLACLINKKSPLARIGEKITNILECILTLNEIKVAKIISFSMTIKRIMTYQQSYELQPRFAKYLGKNNDGLWGW